MSHPSPDHFEIADIDHHFAEFIKRFGGGELPSLAAKALSRSIRQGHICLDLRTAPAEHEAWSFQKDWPDAHTWRSALAKSRAVGAPKDAATPLVLDASDRLYFRRYWNYEQSLAAALLQRGNGTAQKSSAAAADDFQQAAIEAALANRLTIISGGPGTGKTTTVLRILTRLLSVPNGARLRIALAAPTGKAAARLEETLRHGSESCAPEIKARMPQSASTLHRLLGARDGSVYFRHHARNPLPVDVLVIDEASMVALPLMAKVFDALPDSARVILLGDRDQLASVEPGAVLADIADAASAPGSPLANALEVLTKNHRFGKDSGIQKICEAVRDGDAARALEILHEKTARIDLDSARLPAASSLDEKLRKPVLAGFSDYLREKNPAAALAQFSKFRVLCALRRGPFGVEEMNRRIEQILREANLIPNGQHVYPGMPILITRNNHALRLYNGDIGIILPDLNESNSHGDDAQGQQLWTWFIGENNETRRLPPSRLPEHTLAFAMTVHKSQGSEFDRVLLVLPDRDSPVLTRELIYTGLTRARSHVELWLEEEGFVQSVRRRAVRSSGLRDALMS